jgi:hypothetical protein
MLLLRTHFPEMRLLRRNTKKKRPDFPEKRSLKHLVMQLYGAGYAAKAQNCRFYL